MALAPRLDALRTALSVRPGGSSERLRPDPRFVVQERFPNGRNRRSYPNERECIVTNTNSVDRQKTSLQRAAQAVGAVFLLVGILGFIPGVTSNYESLGVVGPESEALLLGIFQVSILHNIVHLLFGVAGLLMARTRTQAKNYLLYGGIIYLILWVYGLVVGHDSPANFVPVNNADNWLHLVLGLGMIALALLLSRDTARATPAGR